MNIRIKYLFLRLAMENYYQNLYLFFSSYIHDLQIFFSLNAKSLKSNPKDLYTKVDRRVLPSSVLYYYQGIIKARSICKNEMSQQFSMP